MQLKRIEIAGFKSFPDLTEVVFGQGVTVVVGPNGCGKSNLTDAVRWVLGEQRPRVLRGGKMEEVIFGGTPQRPAVSASEITLIIDNRAGDLACDYEDVAITRRLDRSGLSEYRLNRVPCRLKDLNDLFMDTGMGSHAYSVIQQGMVDAIISENTDEVRYLFEEAAGVSKYKLRKRTALRKLEATETDLVRLTDLKNEVASRTRSLARQKGKAEKYKRLEEELRELRLIDAARTYRRLAGSRAGGDDRYRAALDRATGLQAQVDAMELEWQTLRLSTDAAEQDATGAADRLAAITQEFHANETRLVQLRDRQTYIQTERANMSERIAVLKARQEDIAKRTTQAHAGKEAAERERDEETRRTQAAEQAYRELKEQYNAASAAHAQLESEYAALNEERARLDSQHAANTERRESRGHQIDELTTRIAAAREAGEQSKRESESLGQKLAELERTLQEQRAAAEAAQRNLGTLKEAHDAAENELRLWSERLIEWQSARDLLAGMIARGEGLGSAAEAVMANRGQWGERVSSFSDRLRPQAGWERAVEVVLADRLGALLCQDDATANAVTSFLTARPHGRAVVLDPSLLKGTSGARPACDDSAWAGCLADKVDCDADVRPWVAALLQSVAVVEKADDARRVFSAMAGHFGVVSMDGLYIEATGALRTGLASGGSIVGRGERLAEIERKLESGRQSEAGTKKRLDEIKPQLEPARAALIDAQSHLSALETQISGHRLTLEGQRARAAEHARVREELETDLARYQASLADDEANRDRQMADKDVLLAKIESLSQRRTESQDQAEALDERLATAGSALNEARVRAVEVVARVNAAGAEIARLAETSTEIQEEKAQIAAREQQHDAETVTLADDLRTAQERHTELAAEQTKAGDQRAAARAKASESREFFSAVDIKVKDIRRMREEAERERGQIEIERSRLDAEIGQFRQRMIETLRADPVEAAPDDSPLADAEVKEKIAGITATIDEIGPVNPLALEEYEHEKQRWDFFEKQIGDLRTAKKELTETITELNRTAGQRFLDTFETARAHFQEVFTELFSGGEADVRLVDPSDPLETPMEVYARPRGKKFIGLRQLSGGERALTALALLFGLYLVKPSPFCILDEVDAPLDDANCGRFLRLIHRFKQRTQFIIVTHNKLTMEAADSLYGVTMEQSGVSKIVSVRLNRAGEEGEEQRGLAEPRIEMDANGMVVGIGTSNTEA